MGNPHIELRDNPIDYFLARRRLLPEHGVSTHWWTVLTLSLKEKGHRAFQRFAESGHQVIIDILQPLLNLR